MGRAGSWLRWARAAALTCVAAAVALPATAGVGDYTCRDPSKVYLGNAKLFQKPCMIASDEVFRRIPEYQEIIEKGLTEKDVRYHFLMRKAGEKFAGAVKKMASSFSHDLVAERGAVEKAKKEAPDVPDRTTQTIEALA